MKAVIPAAGLGTRFIPYTKAQPKEMLPLLDKPAIQYVVEEALASEIHDIVLITGRTKRAIEDHFDSNPELERFLTRKKNLKALKHLRRGLEGARFAYIRQPGPLGNGHAVLCAEASVGSESFAVLLGDDVLVARRPCTASLVAWHRRVGASCIAVQRVPRREVPRYGMVLGEEVRDGLFRIRRIVEKPAGRQVTSNLVTIGRYVFSPSVFVHLRRVHPGRGGEIWLTDGIRSLLRSEDVYAWEFRGRRFDIGNKASWLLANLELAWDSPEYRPAVRSFVTAHSKVGSPRRR